MILGQYGSLGLYGQEAGGDETITVDSISFTMTLSDVILNVSSGITIDLGNITVGYASDEITVNYG